ncbi:hypothetical protein [Domibacillus epiphyticus]|uniref:Uncharacterized protein n=1 Tax=Domibacillus epiphyticus TaxID=1714355 RepID=A0A1V2ABE7_9BACI|nr:hypothetical protein [Domibacillus epiphyticus]OMP68323.1 hypothetical protein BTO28_02295 [Domibacillus epiphyticus]
MAIIYPHIEDPNMTHYIRPEGEYTFFESEEDYAKKVKEWGLSAKKEFWYKGKTYKRLVTIKGYQSFGSDNTANILVIEFQDGHLSCIYPDYLKDMQSGNFGKESRVSSAEKERAPSVSESPNETLKIPSKEKTIPNAVQKPSDHKTQKAKQPAIILPAEKVHFTATVKQLALSWNHFSEENDEVVVLEHVQIVQDEPINVGLAWCSHSKTLKKQELQPGEHLEFDGKIVKKKLPAGKEVEEEYRLDTTVPYKINNPSKIVK